MCIDSSKFCSYPKKIVCGNVIELMHFPIKRIDLPPYKRPQEI